MESAFCIVCGRSDRQLHMRGSGLKCSECVGKKSKRDFRVLQQQQAQALLASSHSPTKEASSPTLSSTLSASLKVPGSPVGSPPRSPRLSDDVPVVEINLEDVCVSVHDPQTLEFERGKSLAVIHTTLHVSETATMYAISLTSRTTGNLLQTVKLRFSQCERVFAVLKDIGGTSLPDMPNKKSVVAFFQGHSPAFIEERRCEMEKFLQAVMSDKFLCRHPKLLDMLRITASEGSKVGFTQDNIPLEQLKEWKAGPLLGKGTFGSVYMGLLANSQFVAVKVVSNLRSSEDSQELQSELELLQGLSHPNIVRYYGTLINDEKSCIEIFTEFVEGGSVASVVKRFGALKISVIRRYIRQLLNALVYLHERNITHRDIKGDNLLVAKHGEVKLADFGCSKQLQNLQASTLAGTPMWMAPEIIRGEEAHLHSDIWSVGCLVIELMAREPWISSPNESPYAIMFRIQATDRLPDGLPDVSEIGATMSEFLKLCFERDVSKRPGAHELLEHPFLTKTDDEIAAEVQK